jgi:DNA-binding Lrp family transcriptional regulator
MSNQIRLDRLDHEILFQLQRDGRLTNVELARRVGLTPPPCLRRVKRLEDAGVITGYRAAIEPTAIGRGLEVFVDVDINASDTRTVVEFEATAAGYPEVVELRRMFGHPDYILRIAVADLVAFETFLTGKLIGLPGVLHVTSHLTMKTIKADG